MTPDERALLKHQATVRAGLPGQVRDAAATVKDAITAARLARVVVAPQLDHAAALLDRCAGDLDRLVEREHREREATGESPVDQQARIERAYWELRRSARPGEGGAGP